jgi:hypothetical protein
MRRASYQKEKLLTLLSTSVHSRFVVESILQYFSFLFRFLCLRFESCVQGCMYLWIVLSIHSGLLFGFPQRLVRRVWRYQRGNQNPYIEEEQTTQWPKEKVQKEKQRSTKHTYKTKDRDTRTPLKTEGELRCSGRVSSFCSTSGTRRVNLVTNPVISRELGNDREVLTTSGTYPWSLVTQIIHSDQPSHGGDRKLSKWWLQLDQ